MWQSEPQSMYNADIKELSKETTTPPFIVDTSTKNTSRGSSNQYTPEVFTFSDITLDNLPLRDTRRALVLTRTHVLVLGSAGPITNTRLNYSTADCETWSTRIFKLRTKLMTKTEYPRSRISSVHKLKSSTECQFHIVYLETSNCLRLYWKIPTQPATIRSKPTTVNGYITIDHSTVIRTTGGTITAPDTMIISNPNIILTLSQDNGNTKGVTKLLYVLYRCSLQHNNFIISNFYKLSKMPAYDMRPPCSYLEYVVKKNKTFTRTYENLYIVGGDVDTPPNDLDTPADKVDPPDDRKEGLSKMKVATKTVIAGSIIALAKMISDGSLRKRGGRSSLLKTAQSRKRMRTNRRHTKRPRLFVRKNKKR